MKSIYAMSTAADYDDFKELRRVFGKRVSVIRHAKVMLFKLEQ